MAKYRRIGGATFYEKVKEKNNGWKIAAVIFIVLMAIGACSGG